jgi:16S rRNA (uracil1498-N3)-methyltransferase
VRRFFVPELEGERVLLPPAAAHHALSVLRLGADAEVELFDGRGTVVRGRLELGPPPAVQVEQRERRHTARWPLHVAAALPKGERLDWMVEKLAELGAASWVPLACERSVVRELSPQKRARAERLAEAAARQAGRDMIMTIEAPATIDTLALERALVLHPTGAEALPVALAAMTAGPLWLVVGPEGGLTDAEVGRATRAGARVVTLGAGVLRVETAAMAAVSVAMVFASGLMSVTSDAAHDL